MQGSLSWQLLAQAAVVSALLRVGRMPAEEENTKEHGTDAMGRKVWDKDVARIILRVAMKQVIKLNILFLSKKSLCSVTSPCPYRRALSSHPRPMWRGRSRTSCSGLNVSAGGRILTSHSPPRREPT